MSRTPARFTQADIRRATRVAKEAGMDVEILPDGTIRLTAPRPVDKPRPKSLAERGIVL